VAGAGDERSVTSGTLQVAASACCFGAIPIFTLLATQRGGAPLASVLAWRYALAGAALVLVAGGPARAHLPRRRALLLVSLGGGGQALIALLGLSALRFIPAATLAFLFYTYPAWVTLIAAARRAERLDRRRVIALALALGGVVALVGAPWAAPPSPGPPSWGSRSSRRRSPSSSSCAGSPPSALSAPPSSRPWSPSAPRSSAPSSSPNRSRGPRHSAES
jgi:drug/metabolite transporter (DMT)-like permease